MLGGFMIACFFIPAIVSRRSNVTHDLKLRTLNGAIMTQVGIGSGYIYANYNFSSIINQIEKKYFSYMSLAEIRSFDPDPTVGFVPPVPYNYAQSGMPQNVQPQYVPAVNHPQYVPAVNQPQYIPPGQPQYMPPGQVQYMPQNVPVQVMTQSPMMPSGSNSVKNGELEGKAGQNANANTNAPTQN